MLAHNIGPTKWSAPPPPHVFLSVYVFPGCSGVQIIIHEWLPQDFIGLTQSNSDKIQRKRKPSY